MKIKISGAAGLAALALAVGGCASSPIPVAKNFAYTAQEKVRSAGHWELLAGDVLNETAQLLARNGAERLPLYVELPAKPTEFEKGFRDFLITGLVQRGFQVKTNPEGAAVVMISSELPEVLNLSTRLLVMREGQIVGEVSRADATQERVLRLMAGVATSAPSPAH